MARLLNAKMEYMLTFHILNVYVDRTQPHKFKFTFKVLLFQTGEVESCIDDEDDRWVS